MLFHAIDTDGIALADEAVIAPLVNVEDVTVFEASDRLHIGRQLKEDFGQAGYFTRSDYAYFKVLGLAALLGFRECLCAALDSLTVLEEFVLMNGTWLDRWFGTTIVKDGIFLAEK